MKERSYLMDELGDPDAPIGSKLWCLYVSNEIRKTYYDKTQLGARLKNLVETFTEHQGWQELGFLTWEKFCESRLQIAAEKLETEARNRVVEIAANARPIMTAAEIGEMGKNNTPNNNYNYGLTQGTSADYLTARIARDNPEVLEGMKQGKYRSVRAAAIDAGIIDPDKARRYQLPTDPSAAGRYLAGRVDAEWMLECYDAFMKAGDSVS
jgi:hypothetical protein